MKKILVNMFVFMMIIGSPIVAFAQESSKNKGNIHTFSENFEVFEERGHTYKDSPTGSEHDKLAADGRIECVQTYTARCTECGDYYYWDKHLYWYS